MDIYKDIVEKSIFNNFKQITIVDITLDSVSTLNVNNGKLELIKKEHYLLNVLLILETACRSSEIAFFVV